MLTVDDKNGLRRLHNLAWRGQLTHINRTPIKFIKSFHTLGTSPDNVVAIGEVPAA